MSLLRHFRDIPLGRRQLFPVACFVIVAAISIWVATLREDDLFSVINLSVLVVTLSIINALNSGLCRELLEHGRELLDSLGKESTFNQALLLVHVDALSELAEHDPAAAERHREKVAAMMMEHHPGLEDELEWIRRKADWN